MSEILRQGPEGALMFWCHGCDTIHMVHHGEGPGPRWTWNGSVEKPTLSPSVLVQWSQWVPPATTTEILEKIKSGEIQQTEEHRVCHSFVKDGRIQFLSDCTHHLAGQTVDLEEWED